MLPLAAAKQAKPTSTDERRYQDRTSKRERGGGGGVTRRGRRDRCHPEPGCTSAHQVWFPFCSNANVSHEMLTSSAKHSDLFASQTQMSRVSCLSDPVSQHL